MADLESALADGVLRVTINREDKRNSLNDAVLDGMYDALVAPPVDARAVLIDSVGEKVFCAGADLAVMGGEATGLEKHEARGGLRRVVLAMRDSPLPVVARVQGLCLAGGVGLAMGCDIVIASENSAFGLPEVNLGLWPFMVSALLARHVSPKIAMELMLSGRRMPAGEAHAAGLVSRVVTPETLDGEVSALMTSLASKPPVAMRLGKAAFAAAQESTLVAGLEAMQAQLSLITQTADAAEGVGAFFERRPPVWTGR